MELRRELAVIEELQGASGFKLVRKTLQVCGDMHGHNGLCCFHLTAQNADD